MTSFPALHSSVCVQSCQANVDKVFCLYNKENYMLGRRYKFNVLVERTYGLLIKREVKIIGYWPSSFFACLFRLGPWTRKKTRPICSHLDRASSVNKGFITWDKTPKHDCVLAGQSPYPELHPLRWPITAQDSVHLARSSR